MTRCERLAPWAVLRASVDAADGTGVPSSVVVKWLRDTAARADPRQTLTEEAALRFLADDLGLALAPRVLASAPRPHVLVLEDLAPRVALDQVLRRDGAVPPPAALMAFAAALGELNAATAGHADRYYARRRALGPVDPRADREGAVFGSWRETVRLAADFGAAMPGAAAAEWTAVLDQLADPGPFLALTNGDPEANNFLVAAGEGRLIDFEFAGYRHALTSAACLHVPGPGWLTVGDPVASGAQDHYRRALARTVPQAADDRLFGDGLAAACMATAVERLHRLTTLDARPPGDPSRPQMISTLESAARAATAHRALPHLTTWSRRVATALRHRWKDADTDLTAHPPYTPRDRQNPERPAPAR